MINFKTKPIKKPIKVKTEKKIKKDNNKRDNNRKENNKKILVTSALPYVNNVPHLGNIIGCVLSADVFARYCRSKGNEVLFVCGTDEHGTATETKALEEGLTPIEICNKYFKIHKEIYEWFGCSFDCFGRTSTKTHEEMTQEIFREIHKNGFITKNIVNQLFCVKCRKFLADRFIEGICPHCCYERARGDQCESCGNLLNATDLKEPKCKMCSSVPEIRESEHLFLNLPKLAQKLKEWSEKQSKKGFWPENAVTVTEAWLKEGLKERCITRDLKWGVPVPLKGFENKVFYVWFDAPIGYISITKHARPDWKEWWIQGNNSGRASEVPKLYQFMAKDNIPFHTILFPATLFATKEKWNFLHHIASIEYLNYEDSKFSKSVGTGVFGDDAIKSGIAPDVWRYYLLANRPETADTKFNWNDFQEKNNHELLANLGNFVNRTLSFLYANFGGVVPKRTLTEEDQKFINRIDGEIKEVSALLDRVLLKEALRKLMVVSKMCNQYFQENEPWNLLKKGELVRCNTVMNICVNMVRDLAVVFEPFLPFTAREIFKQLNLEQTFAWDTALKQPIKEGHKINKPNPMFRKIEEKEIKEYRERFAGKKKNEAAAKKVLTIQNDKNNKTVDSVDSFVLLELKVAKIIDVKKHPNAEKLFIEQIDLGTEKRQIVSGLAQHYSPDELLGQNVVVLCNLKPAKLRGEMSYGMLLAGVKKGESPGSGEIVKVIHAPKSKPGEKVFVDGIALSSMPKEISFEDFEKVCMEVRDGNVLYRGKKLKTSKETVVVDLYEGIVR